MGRIEDTLKSAEGGEHLRTLGPGNGPTGKVRQEKGKLPGGDTTIGLEQKPEKTAAHNHVAIRFLLPEGATGAQEK